MTPPSGSGIDTHCPVLHSCPAGQVTPSQPGLQAPATQTSPAGQVLFSQPVSMQTPFLAPAAAQLRPTAQSRQSPQDGWQAPSSQMRPPLQVTPAQGSTHLPMRQTWLCGQTTPSQPPTQLPAMQT